MTTDSGQPKTVLGFSQGELAHGKAAVRERFMSFLQNEYDMRDIGAAFDEVWSEAIAAEYASGLATPYGSAIPPRQRSVYAQSAERIIYGDREQTYDDPNRNFRRIAWAWSAIMDKEVTPMQVALMMVMLKCVRENHKHQDDNMIDAHGYLMCGERIIREAEKDAEGQNAKPEA